MQDPDISSDAVTDESYAICEISPLVSYAGEVRPDPVKYAGMPSVVFQGKEHLHVCSPSIFLPPSP